MSRLGDIIKAVRSGKGEDLVLSQIQNTIHKLTKEERLIFLTTDKASYIDKQGNKSTLTLDEMAALMVDRAGRSRLEQLGITDGTVKELLTQEYKGGH